MLRALLFDLVVERLPVAIVAVPQMAIQKPSGLAKSDQVLGVEFERRRQVERMLMVNLEVPGPSAPPAARFFDQMLSSDSTPFRRAQACRFSGKNVSD
jgi:hypothetical protein